jgi:3-oxoacyl-(acyl-carrier-protein) synthase
MADGAPGRRVVVTGMGAVSAAGWGVAALARALDGARTAIGEFRRFDHARHRTHVAGEAPSRPPADFERPREWARLSYADRFALFAASEALGQAGLGAPLGEAGVYFGTSTGGLFESELYLDTLFREPGGRGRLSQLAPHQLNAPGDTVARRFQASGPVATFSSACASSALALEAALSAVRAGEVEVAVAGGADSLSIVTYAGFNSLRAVDPEPCRPFREGRGGMSLGEGAAVLVLETLERARERGKEPLAEMLGAGSSCDASHMTAPHPEGTGAAEAIARSLADAGIGSNDVGHVNAHGTGTPLNDAAEWAALVRVFGERASRVPVAATKSVVGHLLGTSGALEAVATVLSLRAGRAHFAAGGGRVDPALSIDLVLHRPRALPHGAPALSTSLGFGGANAALVVAPWNAA